jgi:hypothetical protein
MTMRFALKCDAPSAEVWSPSDLEYYCWLERIDVTARLLIQS